ncbi:hypothetical protein PRZ48_006588 [Zasmidium cellare]|uniref:MYND-type domain-containing protein n=1 Tax=Zasmidium cellare TaxID=395010 RepID=A0ABR0EPS6_ZASCE|nr:hypothetical protein PRZ48_006588 [Zasmidium cellare]
MSRTPTKQFLHPVFGKLETEAAANYGYRLFESEYDQDMIQAIDKDLGLDKHTRDACLKLKDAEQAMGITKDWHATGPDAYETIADRPRRRFPPPIHYSIWPANCTDNDFVHAFLKTSGEFEKLTHKYATETQGNFAPNAKWSVTAGYKSVLLGACAMMRGLTLDLGWIVFLRCIFTGVGLLEEALKEVDTALHGPHGFENGKPYKWGSLGVHAPRKQTTYDELVKNSPGPEIHINMADPKWTAAPKELIEKIRERFFIIEKEHPEDVCGGCGKAGKALMACAKCEKRKYCTRQCQKDHWEKHKLLCAKPPGERSQDHVVNKVGEYRLMHYYY